MRDSEGVVVSETCLPFLDHSRATFVIDVTTPYLFLARRDGWCRGVLVCVFSLGCCMHAKARASGPTLHRWWCAVATW